MNRSSFFAACALAAANFLLPAAPPAFAADAATPAPSFAGTRWALTLPNGAAGWLGITENNGKLEGSLLWGGGNPFPVDVAAKDAALVVTRTHRERRRTVTETLVATPSADGSLAVTQTFTADGKEVRRGAKFSGKRIPALPPRPDLSKLVFGEPVKLIADGDALNNKWAVMNKRAFNGWSLKNGVLSNSVVFNGKPRHGTNLRTQASDFTDFNLKVEVCMAKDGNSGIYLRGIYEIQMADSYGKKPDHFNMGALYGRIAPSVAAEKPAGEWQTVDITLVDRHVTVILNGKKIIDNQPVLGCTGGALTADEFLPGPIYLQGDHTNVSYRNMVLTPIKRG
ncbi:MAG: DUF1080 domain-containing protein [Puniceicoccales bacterium]|jgi:hypothetical protein|nr:DUF1080 domain-containing protein [Puniceicoccales bacterium]